jgi:hypothetical protein
MNDATQTSGLPNTPTGENCLLAIAHWLIALLIIHWVIACGRKLAAALYKPWGPDDSFLAAHFGTTDRAQILTRVTRALHRATALQSDLFARRPTEQDFPIEARYAIRAQITDIFCDLGFFRRAAVRRCSPMPRRALAFRRTVGAGLKPAPTTRTRIQRTATATGPPAPVIASAARREAIPIAPSNNAGVPWSFSSRTPASFSLYALS